MPSTTRTPHQALRRDSWPPIQMHLRRSIQGQGAMDIGHFVDLSLEDDPINSFLTPTPLLDNGDTDEDEDVDMDMDMDLEMNMAFDAGIENSHDPQPAIRSISPSDLTGPSRPPSLSPKIVPLAIRSPTPPKSWPAPRSASSRNSPEALTPDLELDDDEDYVRFTPRGMPLNLPPSNMYHNFGSSKSKGNSRKAAAAAKTRVDAKEQVVDENDGVGMMIARGSATTNTLLPPSGSFHVGRPPVPSSTRGRSTTASGRPSLLAQRPRSWSGATGYSSGRLSPRAWAWREPSPDVYSIEEEPEEDFMSEAVDEGAYVKKNAFGKGWKKVRFSLPVTEEIP